MSIVSAGGQRILPQVFNRDRFCDKIFHSDKQYQAYLYITVIYEAKDGKYGEDGSETLDEYKEKMSKDPSQTSFSNCLGDLKKNIEYLIGMERQSGSMDAISPLYVARMLNVPVDEVERCMREME